MKIFVKVKLKAREERVKKIDKTHFAVWVKERPVGGRANKAVISALANYFNVGQANIGIVFGNKNKNKIIEIYRQGEE